MSETPAITQMQQPEEYVARHARPEESGQAELMLPAGDNVGDNPYEARHASSEEPYTPRHGGADEEGQASEAPAASEVVDETEADHGDAQHEGAEADDAAIFEGVTAVKHEAAATIAPTVEEAGRRLADLADDPTINMLVREIQEGTPQAVTSARQLEAMLDSTYGRGLSEADAWEAGRYVRALVDYAEGYSVNLQRVQGARETRGVEIRGVKNAVDGLTDQELPAVGARLQGLNETTATSPESHELLETTASAAAEARRRLSYASEDIQTVVSRLSGYGPLEGVTAPSVLLDYTYQMQSMFNRFTQGDVRSGHLALEYLGEVKRHLSLISGLGDDLAVENAQVRNNLQQASDMLRTVTSLPLFET